MLPPNAAHQAESRTRSPHSLSTKIKRVLWALVESTLFRCSFHTWNRWRAFLLRTFGATVGKNCIIRRSVKVYYPWNLHIGNTCIIGDNAELYSLAPIRIEDRVMISQYAYLCTGTHDLTKLSLPLVTFPITIHQDAWICAKAFIGPNITVGQGAVAAACSVVVKNVDPWTIVGGNPARFIKPRTLESLSPSNPPPPPSTSAS